MRGAAALVLVALAGCGSAAAPPASDPQLAAVQSERVLRLRERQSERGTALSEVAGQRRRATAELRRLQQVHGHDTTPRFELRYGSDGTGDPPAWTQTGPDATRAPTSTPETIARFQASDRIELVGAAKREEITRGLIDDRVLEVLLTLAERHFLTINSLRISHPQAVQDELGTPTDSNHVYGRAADISAVDGVPCKRETTGAEYHTLVDNPPPAQAGPCLALAYEAAAITGAPEEIIYFWRVPGPAGVSLPNHDDHVHVGFRSYPATPLGQSHTLEVPVPSDGDGTSND
jgi:hypothetical protein